MVFDVKMQVVDEDFTSNYTLNFTNHTLPFCQELWPSKAEEIAYYVAVDVIACYALPLVLITICNIITWQTVAKASPMEPTGPQQEPQSNLRSLQRLKMLRVLKLFTFLTFSFFVCWLPLYVVVARIKLFYTEDFSGTEWEQHLISLVLPIVQLLGSCNSCVNPVLYALLNQTFKESFQKAFSCCRISLIRLRVQPVADEAEVGMQNVVAMGQLDCNKPGAASRMELKALE